MRRLIPLFAGLLLLFGCSDSDDADPGQPVVGDVTVEITSPPEGSLHDETNDITFTGAATAPDGSPLTGSALVWSTAGDPFGTGESVTRSMAVGDHTVVLTATDPGNHVATDSVSITVAAIDPLPWTSYAGMKTRLLEIVDMEAGSGRDRRLEAYMDSLRIQGRFPLAVADSVAFLYSGEAGSVSFPGDFNGWEPQDGVATRLGDTDVWVREEVLPLDARLDYRILRDGTDSLLDPENPRTQRSGDGDNSVLPMPDYVPSPWVERQAGVAQGFYYARSLASTSLGYTVAYHVYTPAGYAGLADLPVLYVSDGHEYADDLMGSMVIVLDNLIDQGLIRPLMAVFIDPRVGGANLREEQYGLNQDFVDFVVDELVPTVDGEFNTSTSRLDRGLLGSGLGGLNSAWFGLQAHEVFFRLGIQSPDFSPQDEAILDLYAAAPVLDIDIFMTWGTFHDMGDVTLRFQAVLDAKGYPYSHLIVNEGHSWGSWRAQLDDILIGFWGLP